MSGGRRVNGRRLRNSSDGLHATDASWHHRKKNEAGQWRLWRKIRNTDEQVAHLVSARIIQFAKLHEATIVVFEHLGNLKPSQKQVVSRRGSIANEYFGLKGALVQNARLLLLVGYNLLFGWLEITEVFKYPRWCFVNFANWIMRALTQVGDLSLCLRIFAPQVSIVLFVLCDDCQSCRRCVQIRPSCFAPPAIYPSTTAHNVVGEDRPSTVPDSTYR